MLCVPLTSNLTWASAPGNTLLSAKVADLPLDSVANASQLFALGRAYPTERIMHGSCARIDSPKLPNVCVNRWFRVGRPLDVAGEIIERPVAILPRAAA